MGSEEGNVKSVLTFRRDVFCIRRDNSSYNNRCASSGPEYSNLADKQRDAFNNYRYLELPRRGDELSQIAVGIERSARGPADACCG
jgi:hypothetical protein